MSKAKDGISYRVIRSDRATADIIIERDGSVLVRAPLWIDDRQIANIVKSKHYWIHQGLSQWRNLNAARVPREYKNGEGFLYLGSNYRLALSPDQDIPLQLKNGRFHLRRDLADSTTSAQAAFRDFYTAKARQRLAARVDYYAPKVDVAPTGVDVRELGHRWATCSADGKLAFHWKCVMAPQTIIDYIVVHELCHLRHRDHDAAFWNEVDKVLSDYHERKEWLRKHGAGLDI